MSSIRTKLFFYEQKVLQNPLCIDIIPDDVFVRRTSFCNQGGQSMISFRDITELEPITEIPENADIIIVVDGVAKRISKADAKFGGTSGEEVTFYIGEAASASR